MHDYVQRRQLTEAAKLLVFSDKPIIEIAFICGYESQQSFTTAFTAMYKTSPAQYRDKQAFYPLLLRFTLHDKMQSAALTKNDIRLAVMEDIPSWMELLRLVVDGYPVLDETDYLHKLKIFIRNRQALVLVFCRAVLNLWGYIRNTEKEGFKRFFWMRCWKIIVRIRIFQ